MKLNFKNISSKFKEASSLISDKRRLNELIMNKMSLKKFMLFVIISNVTGIAYFTNKYNNSNYDLSLSRYLSRKFGNITNIPLPLFLREYVYKGYMKLYKINKEEILNSDLRSYKTIKEFFIREIKLENRPIENASSNVLSSPCDGKVLSISEVQNFKDLIIVKNIKYSILDFLFGNKILESHPHYADVFLNMKKKFFQITIYLSPGDCHRYYSPNNITVSDRIHIPGFLEPVRPDYLSKHGDVLKTNERVTLICEQENKEKSVPGDILFITYVGAFNVGSINLSFDDFLKTNTKNIMNVKDSGYFVLNYADILIPGQSKIERKNFIFYNPSSPLLFQEIDKETEEYDIRDMLDIDLDLINKHKINLTEQQTSSSAALRNLKERLLFETISKEKENLKFNFNNSFMSYDLNIFKKKKQLANPKQLLIENFKVSNKGVHLTKREEMGWFNFGSTIVLIFSVDSEKEIKFNYKTGDSVKIGQSLFEIL